MMPTVTEWGVVYQNKVRSVTRLGGITLHNLISSKGKFLLPGLPIVLLLINATAGAIQFTIQLAPFGRGHIPIRLGK